MRLTYCGNVHPAEGLGEWLETTERFAVPLAREAEVAGQEFGLGVWWSADLVRRLVADDGARRGLADRLEEWRLPLWTLNVFPYGGFHDESVKTAVYRPNWAAAERLRYTVDAARVAAELAPEAAVLPLSTLPLGYADGDRPAMVAALAQVVEAFAQIEGETGCCPVLALEPEPFCLLETVAETASFLEGELFVGAAEEARRRHLGVCVDLCHLAVVGEDALAAIADLRAGGIAVPKIQVSAGLELRDPAAGLDELLAFDEPRYLHQTFGDRGLRALDLGEVRRRRGEFEAAGRLRTHFHLPVFWDQDGALGSTRVELERVLGGLPGPLPLLEVETYTWSVLDPQWRPERDLLRGIGEELAWVRRLLAKRS